MAPSDNVALCCPALCKLRAALIHSKALRLLLAASIARMSLQAPPFSSCPFQAPPDQQELPYLFLFSLTRQSTASLRRAKQQPLAEGAGEGDICCRMRPTRSRFLSTLACSKRVTTSPAAHAHACQTPPPTCCTQAPWMHAPSFLALHHQAGTALALWISFGRNFCEPAGRGQVEASMLTLAGPT